MLETAENQESKRLICLLLALVIHVTLHLFEQYLYLNLQVSTHCLNLNRGG
ncbi:hypothetical protein XSR1_690008 [Xenorhabdus szentirmaii DSM 16338]|uniref:Uncharacterized protein n=1 Tax=Xenorhabdus szentirmaii DSM 16338 TaxID=1427518 RepID=W1J6Y6_9GAMM|nr:hypothetical protein XSR1_690008 [Xenorhabdus szentirmaii DSM 16338]